MTDPSFPQWLHALAVGSLIVAAACALVIAFDELKRPQKMWVMNLVWPLTALFGSVLWLAGYFAWGRGQPQSDAGDDAKGEAPFPVMVAKAASHCGAGCTLGDIVAEWLAFGVPAGAVWFGCGGARRARSLRPQGGGPGARSGRGRLRQ